MLSSSTTRIFPASRVSRGSTRRRATIPQLRKAWPRMTSRFVGPATSRPATPGDYLAFVQGPGENGGYRLYVDKKLVIDDWTQAYAFLSQVKISLPAGPHQINLEYFVPQGLGQTETDLRHRAPRGDGQRRSQGHCLTCRCGSGGSRFRPVHRRRECRPDVRPASRTRRPY